MPHRAAVNDKVGNYVTLTVSKKMAVFFQRQIH